MFDFALGAMVGALVMLIVCGGLAYGLVWLARIDESRD